MLDILEKKSDKYTALVLLCKSVSSELFFSSYKENSELNLEPDVTQHIPLFCMTLWLKEARHLSRSDNAACGGIVARRIITHSDVLIKL